MSLLNLLRRKPQPPAEERIDFSGLQLAPAEELAEEELATLPEPEGEDFYADAVADDSHCYGVGTGGFGPPETSSSLADPVAGGSADIAEVAQSATGAKLTATPGGRIRWSAEWLEAHRHLTAAQIAEEVQAETGRPVTAAKVSHAARRLGVDLALAPRGHRLNRAETATAAPVLHAPPEVRFDARGRVDWSSVQAWLLANHSAGNPPASLAAALTKAAGQEIKPSKVSATLTYWKSKGSVAAAEATSEPPTPEEQFADLSPASDEEPAPRRVAVCPKCAVRMVDAGVVFTKAAALAAYRCPKCLRVWQLMPDLSLAVAADTPEPVDFEVEWKPGACDAMKKRLGLVVDQAPDGEDDGALAAAFMDSQPISTLAPPVHHDRGAIPARKAPPPPASAGPSRPWRGRRPPGGCSRTRCSWRPRSSASRPPTTTPRASTGICATGKRGGGGWRGGGCGGWSPDWPRGS